MVMLTVRAMRFSKGKHALWPMPLRALQQNTCRLFERVTMAAGIHLFPFRTEKLSPPAPMVLRGRLRGRVGRRPFFLTFRPRGAGVFPYLRHSASALRVGGRSCG